MVEGGRGGMVKVWRRRRAVVEGCCGCCSLGGEVVGGGKGADILVMVKSDGMRVVG